MANIWTKRIAVTARYGLLVGVAGGIAEIIWIALYGSLAGTSAAMVASAVGATVSPALPGTALAAAPVLYGVLVHMALAAGLGVALVFAWHALTGRRPRHINEYAFMLFALAIVWAVNFFVVLPLINPAFVELVPYPVSLASKLLFGVAAAVLLRHAAMSEPARIPVRVRTR